MATWTSPFQGADIDRSPVLSPEEREELLHLKSRRLFRQACEREGRAARLFLPLKAALEHVGTSKRDITLAWGAFIDHMLALDRAYFGWDDTDWETLIGSYSPRERWKISKGSILAVGYLLCDFRGFLTFKAATTNAKTVADKVFGAPAVEAAQNRVFEALGRIGYPPDKIPYVLSAISLLLLKAASPRIEDITVEHIDEAYAGGYLPEGSRRAVFRVSRALKAAGHIVRTARIPGHHLRAKREGIAPEWASWCERWRSTSSLSAKNKQSIYGYVVRAGLWLADRHPEIKTPGDWSTQTCLDYLAMVSCARVGEYAFIDVKHRGKALMAKSKEEMIYAARRFFSDLQQWKWIEPRFAPHAALGLPDHIRHLVGPSPRDIEEKTWLKLVWASLNLAPGDLPISGALGMLVYPYALVRAAAILWTHAGLRVGELIRLRCDCIRAQSEEIIDEESGRKYPPGSICYLSVPYNKTSPPFAKPVAGAVQEAVGAWLAERPDQPKGVDSKTAQPVDFLFSYKGRQLSISYINHTVIPMLCRKAGLPLEDAKGKITSHRGRSSAVTMLANARQGMSLLELMKWCGHKNPASTMHYLRLRPGKLARAYAKADESSYLIEVLIDQEAVLSGAAATGAPWKYYDLGHSYCTHAFWSTCPHRLACAGCAFNVPKASSRGEAIAAKAFLGSYLERVPLTDDERQAVRGDLEKLDAMLAKLERMAAPDGRQYPQCATAEEEGGRRQITPLIPLPIVNEEISGD